MKNFKRLFAVMIVVVMALSIGVLAACEPTVPVEAFEIDKVTLSVDKGGTGELTITINFDATNKGVEWKSADTTIATVAAKEGNEQVGVVTGVKAGTTTITATSKDNAEKQATCTITVRSQKILSLTTVGGNNFYQPDGSEQEITLNFYDDNSFDGTRTHPLLNIGGEYSGTWAVENNNLTITSKFVLLGAEYNHAFQLKEGEGVCAGSYVLESTEVVEGADPVVQGFVLITVEQLATLGVTKEPLAQPVKVESLTASALAPDQTINLKSGDFIASALYVTVLPENASNPTLQATVKSNEGGALKEIPLLGLIQALKPGTAKVEFATTDGSNKTIEMTVNVTNPEKLAGIGDAYFDKDVSFTGVETSFLGETTKFYTFKADGTLEMEDDGVVAGYGYYSIEKTDDAVTKIVVQRFGTDSEAVKEFAVTEENGAMKFTTDNNVVMTQGEKVYKKAANITDVRFDEEKTFEGTFGGFWASILGSRKYVFKADGTLAVYVNQDEQPEQTGYYCVVKDSNGVVTKIIMQRFGDDKGTAYEYAVTDKDGKMAVQIGTTELPLEIVEK